MKAPVLQIAALTYRDAWRVCQAMPVLLGIALVVCLAESVVTDKFSRDAASVTLITNLIGSVVGTCLIAPVLIAIYRFILLDDRTAEYRIDFQDPRLRRFLGYSFVLLVIFHVGLLAEILFERASAAATLWLLVIWLGWLVITIKLTLLFPAIAVDIPSVRFGNAMAATDGNFWRIVGICIVVSLPVWPLVALSGGIESLREPAEAREGLLVLAGEALIGFVNFIIQLMLAVAASHLFRLLSSKMRSGPGSAVSSKTSA